MRLKRKSFLLNLLCVWLVACGSGGSASPPRTSEPPLALPEAVEEVEDFEDVEESIVSVDEFDPHWGVIGAFTDAATCADCHSAATDGSGVLRYPQDADGEDISPYAGWKHSAMAHSFDDPIFQAQLAGETAQFPALAGTIEDKCLTCHSPMAHSNAHSTLTSLETEDCPLDDEGCYRLESAAQQDMAREGVSCTLCHQIDAQDLGEAASGKYVIYDSRIIYGPYSDPLAMPMQRQTQYTVMGASHIQSSELCATCHDLKTPTVDVNTDALTGAEFVEQSPYAEWLNSTYSEGDAGDRSCQDCHMPVIEDYSTAIATKPNGDANPAWPERDTYSQHGFRGGNVYVLELLRDFRAELGIAGSTTAEGFDAQIASNTRFMRNRTATLSIDSAQLDDDLLEIAVTIRNRSGHKLPTSFPSRRVWVNLVVSDADGAVLFESGTPDADGRLGSDARLAQAACLAPHKPADFVATRCYLPHRDVVSNAAQVPVYEAVMADVNGQVTYTLLYGARYVKDNRIPPAGFTADSPDYSADIAVAGRARNDADFNNDGSGEGSGSDTVHYRLPWAGLDNAGLHIEARLYFQSLRPAFAASLLRDNPAGERFAWMHEQRKPQPDLLDETSLEL
ncbi:hypothetical protein E4634_19110 [Mangrovimicrobium sediminis]|uniref:Uncharacterized protein n=1 Tax=Mangrovimicrobium sediminis TaxID=2562682 RepID=A0A4Z0LVM6_9GAMM|nr:hypothetical protein [Haliea sp. SAOS-164]TGD71382.1 hypothetical protein E4634_19110 [Haliea sp. SAOS-164]